MVLQHEQQAVRIPEWVVDLPSFRRWATSDEFPTVGWYGHLDGELWADISLERLIHNRLKTEVAVVLGGLVKLTDIGEFLSDRMLLTHKEAALSTEPDGMFVSFASLKSGKAVFESGEDSLEVVGTPDLVIEVVSPTSRQKDTEILPRLYHRAGITEYWLIEPLRRTEEVSFDILKWTPTGYASSPNHDGWIDSVVMSNGPSSRIPLTALPFFSPAGILSHQCAARFARPIRRCFT
jgi:Uma2 family endonuclease